MYGHGPSPVAVDDGVRYDDARYDDGYGDASYDQAPFDRAAYEQAPFDRAAYEQVTFDRAAYEQATFDQTAYARASFEQAWRERRFFDQAPYQEARYQQTGLSEAFYDDGAYQQAPYEQTFYEDGGHDEARFDEAVGDDAPHARYDRSAPAPRKPGAHRHAKPSRKRRKPVRIAAAVAGSTLLVAGAVPVAAHWWHRPGTHPDADQASLPATPGAASGAQIAGQPVASQNALDQWAQIPIGKHAAAEARVAQRAAKPLVKQPSHSPQPAATAAAAYQNPLRDVSSLVLERVDMGVDFGGSGPVFALGDGVITNATGDSSGWPGGGWITYQLTDGPDSGLVVYVAEDVKPTVQVGEKVTSSTVIANMFNGGDGIETGWATSDSSTAESQMAAAGGISGGGPFPTMVGLSFDAVLESVGVPAAPNAGNPGNGLLPAGYPPV
jgi:hypothetical protein